MEKLIPVINKLQDVFHNVGMLDTIDLPQIAVVGSQSSGKSSVLENIVGRDFLPRGSGIVTRRPLVLQLIHNPVSKPTPVTKPVQEKGEEAQNGEKGTDSQANPDEWGEFLHIPNKRFYNFSEIRDEINNETDRVTGKNKGISPLPIHLKIYSPHVLNLTLIDLPGITKVPVGDQPKDIENQIRKMIVQYISKPNCIILAVTAANTDIANSDALKLAREQDKRGDRTVGVLTKLDIMDSGTDCLDVLQGKVIPLKLGYIGVVNRSQQDIHQSKQIRDALRDEARFFANSPVYKSMAEKMGIPYLSKQLNLILLNHIRQVLPEIKNKIAQLISQAQQRLLEYGDPISGGMSNGALLLSLLTKFSTDYVDVIDGRNTDLSTNDLFGGARINHIFTKKFSPYLSKMDACENLTEFDIRNAIRNAKGPRTSLFIPEASFEMLVKKQVKMLEDPSLRCVDQVFEELAAIVDHCEKNLLRFPNLKEKTKDFVIGMLREYMEPLKEFIRNLIAIELAYINTNHPDFFRGGQTAILLIEKLNPQREQQQQPPQQYRDQPVQQSGRTQQQPVRQGSTTGARQPVQQQPQQDDYSQGYNDQNAPMDRETQEIEIIRQLLAAYFAIVLKNISDSVPKAIMNFLVNKSKSNMQSELVRNLYKEDLFEDLLRENDEIALKRKATAKMLKVLQRAQDIINEVRDLKL